MKRKVQKLLFSLALAFCVQFGDSYAQERDLSVVFTPVKSTMLTKELLQEQEQLELEKIKDLDEAALEELYQDLPDRPLDGMQSRTMTYETQKACRGVEREYKIDLRFVSQDATKSYWDFGDGKPKKMVPISPFAGTLETTYSYTTPGVYLIQIEFFDSSYRPTRDNVKKINVIVEVCNPPRAPQLPVNPNIHKFVVE
ncbi:hypothetical protein [Myroides sp. TSA_177.3]|uniref:hypothetical protein n=1 Tax=Myroides sp. TSA_177.3 TaxID=3415650 RepID=UPI004045255B